MTATQIIYGAMRRLAVLRQGQGNSPETLADGLTALNDMIDGWNTDRLLTYTIARSIYPLVANQQTYALGPGGDFDDPRPVRIESATIISTLSASLPLETPLDLIDDLEWSGIRVKNIYTSLPQQLYSDGAYPQINLSFYPIPSLSTLQVAIHSWQQLTAFADLTTDYAFPPGYAEALRMNLALQLAPEMAIAAKDKPLLELILQQARESKARIESVNAPSPTMACDPAVRSRGGRFFNYLTGE